MIRKISSTFIIILLISLFVASPAQAAKSYYAEYFNVQIDLQEAGSAIITETVKFRFEGDPFTFAFREISSTQTDGVTFLEASMDGVPMSRGTWAGQVEIEAGDPLKVTWHFSPTSDAAHVFVLRYQVDGVIRKGDGDTLIWRAIPEDHDYSIESSTITLTYPSRATVLEQPKLSWNYDSAWEENRIILTTSGIAADEDLILSARFAPDSLTDVAPRWQIQKEQAGAARAKALPVGFIAAIGTLIVGSLGLFTYIRADRRDLNISPTVSSPNPPSDISPAIIGKLMKQQHTFMGAIFDLAQRGVLEVREEQGLWGTKNHMMVRKDHAVSLKPFEQGLMNALFKPNEIQIKMNEVSGRLATKNNLFDEQLEQELIQRGWLDPDRKQKRSMLFGIGLTALFLVIAVFIAAVLLGIGGSQNIELAVLFAAVAGASLGVFILALALLIYAGTFSVLTPAGEEQSARWTALLSILSR